MGFISETYKQYDILGDSEGVVVWSGTYVIGSSPTVEEARKLIDDRRASGWLGTAKGTDPMVGLDEIRHHW